MRAIVPPQPNSPSSGWGARTSAGCQFPSTRGVYCCAAPAPEMDDLDTAQLAAMVAAVGVGLMLLGRTRLPLLAGFAVVAVAEVGLLRGGSLPRLSPALGAAGVAAPALGIAPAWGLSPPPEVVVPLVLAAGPLPRPPSVGIPPPLLLGGARPGAP